MVGPLKKRKNDPNGKGRGPGWYYHRGNGKWSKYSNARDLDKISRNLAVPSCHNKGYTFKKTQEGDIYRHTTDHKASRECVVRWSQLRRRRK